MRVTATRTASRVFARPSRFELIRSGKTVSR